MRELCAHHAKNVIRNEADKSNWPDGKRFAFTVFDDTDCGDHET